MAENKESTPQPLSQTGECFEDPAKSPSNSPRSSTHKDVRKAGEAKRIEEVNKKTTEMGKPIGRRAQTASYRKSKEVRKVSLVKASSPKSSEEDREEMQDQSNEEKESEDKERMEVKPKVEKKVKKHMKKEMKVKMDLTKMKKKRNKVKMKKMKKIKMRRKM
ncbi:hypothetical protein Sjap_005226 [Stephania japonica]|uniref:Uncharacterized protein n=1 Tax=Stephania japonica TaxID=461633 RepID=A0AAP0K567_9MAGN